MSSTESIRVPYAELDWKDGTPFSKQFGDVYFQVEDGLNESRYVFLESSRLRDRLTDDSNSPLTVVETGFGSGLNFITTYQAWMELPPPKRPLEFISFEAYPMAPDDLETAYKQWPELKTISQKVREQYPEPLRGTHTLEFEHGQVKLTLVFGVLVESLSNYDFYADAWYLDGFAPSSNETMWQETLFQYMGNHSNPEATVSTFTAAGFVKRGLQNAGFDIQKVKGFGKKREMLSGTYTTTHHTVGSSETVAGTMSSWSEKWYAQDPISRLNKNNREEPSAIVVGAGLAGLTTAYALAQRGIKVRVLEQKQAPVDAGSGQNQLVMYGKYPAQLNPEARFTLASHAFSQNFYNQLQKTAEEQFWHPCGVLQLSWTSEESLRHQRILERYDFPESFCRHCTIDETSEISGANCNSGGLYFPNSGWLSPKALSREILQHPRIQTQYNCNVEGIHFDQATNQWTAISRGEEMRADSIILCTADKSSSLLPQVQPFIKPLRGQTTQVNADAVTAPKLVLCGNGYLCPERDGQVHFGATYDLANNDSQNRPEDDQKNIQALLEWLPNWADPRDLIASISHQKSGIRCTTRDYIPIIGQVHNEPEMLERFDSLRRNAKKGLDQYGCYFEGLYINIGHGSKGTLTTPLAASYLADLITGKPIKVSKEYRMMCSPARFLIRALQRNKPYPPTSKT